MSQVEHIKDDLELLAQFVLGRLPEGADAVWKAHVASCASCAEAVRQELALAAGIRRAGRDGLKTRLAGASKQAVRSIPWPRIVSIAAMIAVVAGLGIYERWFTGDSLPIAPLNEKPIQAQRDVPYQPPAHQPLSSTARQDQALAEQHVDKDMPLDAKGYAAPAPMVAGKAMDQLKSDKEMAKGETSGIASTESADEVILQKSVLAERRENAPGIWIEGTRLGTESTALRDAAVTNRVSAAPMVGAAGQMAAETEKKSKSERADAGMQQRQQLQISVSQRPSSSLPPAQQVSAQAFRNRVQARAVRTGDSLSLTLYLDSLLDQRTMERARVSQVGEDSVVVELGSDKIGFGLEPVGRTR